MRRPVERAFALEALADEAQDGHLALGPFDAADALGGEAEVRDIVGGSCAGGGHQVGCLLAGEEAAQRLAMSGQGEPRRWMSRSSKRVCSA